jgi:hypothetical protein
VRSLNWHWRLKSETSGRRTALRASAAELLVIFLLEHIARMLVDGGCIHVLAGGEMQKVADQGT